MSLLFHWWRAVAVDRWLSSLPVSRLHFICTFGYFSANVTLAVTVLNRFRQISKYAENRSTTGFPHDYAVFRKSGAYGILFSLNNRFRFMLKILF